jgi:diguanylate cyclase (GGDEF)-like protein
MRPSAASRHDRRTLPASRGRAKGLRPGWRSGPTAGAELAQLRRDLAETQRRLRELEALAATDLLCQVLNRRGFDRELARALAHAERYGGSVGLICIDLDGFKAVNDKLGHAAGDRLLAAAAEALVAELRASDSVARIGGDEFCAILHNISDIDASVKALHLEERLTMHLQRLAVTEAVGASCGSAIAMPGEPATTLMMRADLAMYARKRARKAAAQAMMSGVNMSSR